MKNENDQDEKDRDEKPERVEEIDMSDEQMAASERALDDMSGRSSTPDEVARLIASVNASEEWDELAPQRALDQMLARARDPERMSASIHRRWLKNQEKDG